MNTQKLLGRSETIRSGDNVSGSTFYLRANTTLVSIKNLLKGSVAISKAKLRKKKLQDEKKRNEQREQNLETEKSKDKKSFLKSAKPGGIGVVGWFKNFIGQTLKGLFLFTLLRNAPMLEKILPMVVGAANFLSGLGMGLLNGFATIVDFGYDAFNSTKNILKDVGGENVANLFDGFMNVVGNIIDVLIIASIVRSGGGFRGLGKGLGGILGLGAFSFKDIISNLKDSVGGKKTTRVAPTGSGPGTAADIAARETGIAARERRREALREALREAREAGNKRDIEILEEREELFKKQRAITQQELQVDYDQFNLQQRRRETGLRRKRLSQLGSTVSERRKNALAAKQRRFFELMQNSSVRKAMELDAFLGGEGFTNDRIVKAIRKVKVLDRRIEIAQIKGQIGRADQLLLERENILKRAGIKKKKFFRSTQPLSLKPLIDPITPADVKMYEQFGIDVDPGRRAAANAQVMKDIMDDFDDFEKGPPQKPMTKRQARIDKGMDELLDEVLKPEQTPGQIFARGGKKAGKRTLLKIFGKKGLKLIARIPVIGPIVDFGLNLAFGDPPGRAASKAIFAGIFGGLGAAIGSIVPVVGTIIGGILGGVGGDIVGGILYDMVAGKLGLSTEIGQGIIPPTTGFIESTIKNLGGLVQGVTDSISGTAKILDKSSKPRADKPFSMPDSVSSDKEFLSEVDNLAKKYNVSVGDLLAVMSFETAGSFDPAQKNLAGSGATGLIQFMPSTARGLGTTTEDLARMSRTEQLKYVDKYLSNKGIEGKSLSDIYMAVLFPAAVGKPDSFVLFGRGASTFGSTDYSKPVFYDQNRSLDINNDGSITKGEAAARVQKIRDKSVTLGDQSKRNVDPLRTTPGYANASSFFINRTQMIAMADTQTPTDTVIPVPNGGGFDPFDQLYKS